MDSIPRAGLCLRRLVCCVVLCPLVVSRDPPLPSPRSRRRRRREGTGKGAGASHVASHNAKRRIATQQLERTGEHSTTSTREGQEHRFARRGSARNHDTITSALSDTGCGHEKRLCTV